MNTKGLLAVTVLLIVMIVAGSVLWRVWPDLRPVQVAQTQPSLDDPALIERGRYLAAAGNCVACHTRQGGPFYAGGRRIATPFGTIYSSNLTPDAETGLGRWSTADFWKAMHHGRSRNGRLLYPAFPYTSYSKVTRADSDAIFAYLKSLEPVHSAPPEHALRFPYNRQAALMAWRGLFFEPKVFTADTSKSKQWNRGAYLVEGLGHCSACHTARGALGQTLASANYAGGPIPGLRWSAPPLANPKPMSEDRAEELVELLGTGVSARNATTGPMAEVVFHSLQYLTQADLRAMVRYLGGLSARPAAREAATGLRVPPTAVEQMLKQGEQLYVEHCADCHGEQGQGVPRRYPALAGNRMVISPSTANVINSVMMGGFPPSTKANPRPFGMPPYAQQFTAGQTAAVISYIRQAWGNNAPAVSPLDINRR